MTTENSRADALPQCPECNGRGAYDDPPWGIVPCPRCNGKGSLRVAALPVEQPAAAPIGVDTALLARLSAQILGGPLNPNISKFAKAHLAQAKPEPLPADERAAFEAALDKRAKSAGFEVGRMTECELDNAWWGWQAGRAASANETGAEVTRPSGYAYRYRSLGGTVIRFNGGGEVNGSRPIEAVPYWFAAPQPAQADARVGLTDEQREAIQRAIDYADMSDRDSDAEALRALLQGANHAG